jgi:protein-S-isoprenylcysteine O-methyltransferase Ste14
MKPFTKIADFILAIVALVHLARVFFNETVMIGNLEIPMWVSIVGCIVASILSIGLWRESK